MKQKILISGGKGLLASTILSSSVSDEYEICAPSKQIMNVYYRDDIKNHFLYCGVPDIFIHAGAYTTPLKKHETNPVESIRNNIVGTCNVVEVCCDYGVKKIIYISTDYVYKGDRGDYKESDEVLPVNNYARSKLAGELAVQMVPNSLVVRTAFTGHPFRHKKAFIDSYKSYMRVDEFVEILFKLIRQDVQGIINVGGKRRSVYEYAIEENENVGKIFRQDIDEDIPYDTSMNLEKMKEIV